MWGIQEILGLYLQDKPMANDVQDKAIACNTPGFNEVGAHNFALFYLYKSSTVAFDL